MPPATDRRLREVYDALDAYNYKQALKLCDSVLKKGSSPIFQALKAMALLRTSKSLEALSLATDARRGIRAPVDDALLHALAIFYRAAGQLEDVAACYEEAVMADPANESANSSLFYAYVRMFDFAKQQQVAMKLQRQFPAHQRQYLMWVLTSMLLQARIGGTAEPVLAGKLLQLATMMMDKAGGPCTATELGLALAIAEAMALRARERQPQDAEAEAAAVRQRLSLLRDHGSLLGASRADVAGWEAACEAQLGNTEAAVHIRETALLESADENWEAVVGYLRELLPTDCGSGMATRPDHLEIASATDRALQTLGKLAELQPRARSPALALVEVRWRLAQLTSCCAGGEGKEEGVHADGADLGSASLESAAQAGLAESLVAYVHRYADRPCCFVDVRPYLAAVAGDAARRTLSSRLDEACGQGAQGGAHGAIDDAIATTRRGLQRKITALQCRAALRAHASLAHEALISRASELGRDYAEACPMGEDLEKTELQPADGLALGAAALLCGDACPLEALAPPLAAASAPTTRAQAWSDACALATRRLGAALLLEKAAARSTANFQCRLRLIAIYTQLGAPGAAREHFDVLGTRKLQLESLQYLILPATLAFGHLRQAAELAADTLAWYPDAMRDVSDTAVLPYKHDNYVQALDMATFRARLLSSRWRVVSETCALYLWLGSSPGDTEAAREVLRSSGLGSKVRAAGGITPFVSSLCDNCDTAVFESSAPKSAHGQLTKGTEQWLHSHIAQACALEAACDPSTPADQLASALDAAHAHAGSPILPCSEVGLAALRATPTAAAMLDPRRWAADTDASSTGVHVAKDTSSGLPSVAPTEEVLEQLREHLSGLTSSASGATAAIRAQLTENPAVQIPEACATAAVVGVGEDPEIVCEPCGPHAIAQAAALASVQLPVVALLLNTWARGLSQIAPKRSKKAGADESKRTAETLSSFRTLLRESALELASGVEDLAADVRLLGTMAETGRCVPVPLLVLEHVPDMLKDTVLADTQRTSLKALEARLRASYLESGTQVGERLVRVGAALRQVR